MPVRPIRVASMTACVLAAGLALTTPAPLRADDKPLKGDLKAIQGEWVSKDDNGESTWVFKGDRLSIKAPNRAYEIAVTLDPEAKPQKAMDFDVLETSPNAKGTKAKGIYKLDGETLRICFGAPDAERPQEFKADFQTSFQFDLKRK